MPTGRAALFTGAGQPFQLATFKTPDPEPGDVLIRITRANVCGSDVHAWAGHYDIRDTGATLPTVLGHEACGVVAALGAGIAEDAAGQPLAVGDRVAFTYFTTCGQCSQCVRGRTELCTRRQVAMWGSADDAPHFVGMFADYFYAPAGTTIFKAPDDVDDSLLAGANCALAQVIAGFSTVEVGLGDTVVIQGAGGLGLYATAIAREKGAGQVVVVDAVQDRLDLAKRFGATNVVNIAEHGVLRDRVRHIRKLTGGGAHLVIEVAGVARAFGEGLSLVANGGQYLTLGNVGSAEPVEVNPARIIINNLTVKGSCWYRPESLRQAIAFLQRNRHLPVDELAGATFALDDIDAAFAAAQGGSTARPAVVMNR